MYKIVMKYIFKLTMLVLIMFFFIEVILQIFGYEPFHPYPFKLKNIQPESSMRKDSLLGFSLKPGLYTYEYESGYCFTATHNKNGYRVCVGKTYSDSLEQINFYGGSLFYGFGLNDSLTLPWKLQSKLDNFKINNFAIFGHSPVSTLLQLKKQIVENKTPKIAIITFASYDSDRVIFSWKFRRNLYSTKKNIKNNLNYVYARKVNNIIKFENENFNYTMFPLANKLASINMLEELIYAFKESVDANDTHIAILKNIIDLCNKNNITPVLFSVTQDDFSVKSLEIFKNEGVITKMSNVNYMDEHYNLMPNDNHPNSNATTLYSLELLDLIEQINL